MTASTTREPDAPNRLAPVWHGLFAATLLVPTLIVLVDTGYPPSGRLFTAGLVAGLVAWHWLGLVRHPAWWSRTPLITAYWLGVAVFTMLLTGQHSAYAIVVYSLYPLMFLTLGWWGLAPILGITGLIAWRAGQWQDAGAGLLHLLTTCGLALVIAVFVDAVERQSERRREALEALEQTRAELAATARHAGILEERQRLAREIHDTVAQGLTSIVTQLEAAEQALDGQPAQTRRHLVNARRSARDALTEVRRSVRDLRPDLLDGASLADALGRACRRWSAETGILVQARVTGTPAGLHPDTETALLRTAQEALANVAKHAGANRVTVTLSYLGDAVTLDVDDDGIGFSAGTGGPRPADPGGGFGLAGMRERLAAVGGRLDVESTPGSGTTIAASVPA